MVYHGRPPRVKYPRDPAFTRPDGPHSKISADIIRGGYNDALQCRDRLSSVALLGLRRPRLSPILPWARSAPASSGCCTGGLFGIGCLYDAVTLYAPGPGGQRPLSPSRPMSAASSATLTAYGRRRRLWLGALRPGARTPRRPMLRVAQRERGLRHSRERRPSKAT
jgi:hypothetical protein